MRQRHNVKQERAERREQKLVRKAHRQIEKDKAQEQKVTTLDTSTGAQGEYVPSLSVLFRILTIVRLSGALLSPIQDCDEVYNYLEPLHFLQFGEGKQTWEYAPEYALRSYGYLFLHKWAVQALHVVFGFRTKTQVFYALRIILGLASAGCEALMIRMVAEWVDRRIANYLAVGLFGMAGMFHSAVAMLPSSFSMCAGMVASAFAMVPPAADLGIHLRRRTVPAVLAFMVAAAVGWPYAALTALPFVAEELLIRAPGGSGSSSDGSKWRIQRALALVCVGSASGVVVIGWLAAVDSYYYGRPVFATWSQIAYNVLGRHGGTAALYGTEPWYFYLKNGLLNGNILMILALLVLPLWLSYYATLRVLLARSEPGAVRAVTRLLDAHWLLLFRMLPFHLVLVAFSLLPHKEERFLSIVYPHMCFCAAAALGLIRTLFVWAKAEFSGKRPLAKSRGLTGFAVFGVAACLGLLRMTALTKYYAAPVRAFMELAPADAQAGENLGPLPLGPTVKSLFGQHKRHQEPDPLQDRATTVCMGEDWYWFPSSYWLPRSHQLQFVTGLGHIGGHLPGDFIPVRQSSSTRASTSHPRTGFNSQNAWEPLHAIPLFPNANSTQSSCDYVVHIENEQDSFAQLVESIDGSNGRWTQMGECQAVLDASRSGVLARILYLPKRIAMLLEMAVPSQRQVWAHMCVFRQRDV
ncbi:mannosyltransferase [Coemansia guatemalensis]|uniref:Mannosyltransferase n=1 Tax=Coemansia guatemalensis TaxID=2761395 RepID=A0A9W8HXD1_9FUNG|nr:mannosyltransferase [Coemansia guatemalensis]